MGNMIRVQKGTKDILPQEIDMWYLLEDNARRIFTNAGYGEIRTPIFESTELFARGVGNTTDIVNKEMYTFEKSDRSLTLRPRPSIRSSWSCQAETSRRSFWAAGPPVSCPRRS